MTVHAHRLAALRQSMAKLKLTALIIPRSDEFQGEYVPPHAERLKWLTGFSGSWGQAVVMAKQAAIFVDGRYTVQVAKQVDRKLFAYEDLIKTPPSTWLAGKLKAGDRLGFDPWLTSVNEARRLEATCKAAKATAVATPFNLVSAIWSDAPPPPATEIYEQPLRYAGQSSADKRKAISALLKDKKADALVLSDPASVAWVFNLRASDVPHTPFALAFAILHFNGTAEIFADGARATPALRKSLGRSVRFVPPYMLLPQLKSLAKAKAAVVIDPAHVPQAIATALSGALLIEAADPCTLPKARKNRAEQAGARAAQIRDGAALANYLCWMETNAASGTLTEFAAQEKLLAFRIATGKLKDLSFGSISAAGPNAALPHYHVEGSKGRTIRGNDIYLIDSGGQYQDGTTDVTRTIIIGTPSPEMKDRFTRVLKGMIAITVARFPEGTTGTHLDALARNALWQGGYDFDHGTGHGVGSFLSVHEGPASISKRPSAPLQPGMIISNEPGYYKQGYYGIRTENLLLVTGPDKVKGADRAMLGFETLTFAPIDRKLIDASLLTRVELQWLDAYHAEVWKKLSPLVDAATKPWLKKACAPLG